MSTILKSSFMASDCKRFEKFENEFHKKYDDIELSFTPRVLVRVHLLSFRRKTPSFSGLLKRRDNKSIQFAVSCPNFEEPSLRSFTTHNASSCVSYGLSKLLSPNNEPINQTFQFVLPQCHKPDEEFPIVFEAVFDRSFLHALSVEKQSIDAYSLPNDGSVSQRTLTFSNSKVELNVMIGKTLRESPEFRYSLGLSSEERDFRKKRIPIVCESMKKILGKEEGPKTFIETPVVSVVCSGGGYRAMAGMAGAMKAFGDAGLLDLITYVSGLSGSAWYLTSAYAHRSMKAKDHDSFHEFLRDGMTANCVVAVVKPSYSRCYEKYLSKRSYKKHGQTHTFANYFPGFTVGSKILRKQMLSKLSDISSYIEDGSVPYPVFAAMQVKNRVKSNDYHTYMEISPHEISYPSYGVSIKTKDSSATWYNGFRVQYLPELPLHFIIAMTGCALSILTSHVEAGGEYDKRFYDYVEEQRIKEKKTERKKKKMSKDFLADISSADELLLDEKEFAKSERTLEESKDSIDESNYSDFMDEMLVNSVDELDETNNQKPEFRRLNRATIKELEKGNPEFLSRNAVFGRTVKLNNFSFGMENIKRFNLNPIDEYSPSLANLISNEESLCDQRFGDEQMKYKLNTSKPHIHIADAGVFNNVAPDIMLRPQRTTDVMIVLDFNAYEDDDHFDYQPLITALLQAWKTGIEVPLVNVKRLTNMPPKEFLILPSHGPNCPTILWFTLSNKKFRKLKNYKPKSTAKPRKDNAPKFNDFPVYGEGNLFDTKKLQMDTYNFDQLQELMYFNVQSHVKEIKSAITEAVLRRRQRHSE